MKVLQVVNYPFYIHCIYSGLQYFCLHLQLTILNEISLSITFNLMFMVFQNAGYIRWQFINCEYFVSKSIALFTCVTIFKTDMQVCTKM